VILNGHKVFSDTGVVSLNHGDCIIVGHYDVYRFDLHYAPNIANDSKVNLNPKYFVRFFHAPSWNASVQMTFIKR